MIDALLEPDVYNYLGGNSSQSKPALGGGLQGQGSRVLITSALGIEGIYYLEKNAAGNFYFTYSIDADPSMGYLTNGAFTFVEQGTHAGKGYVFSNGQWKQFSANSTDGVWQEFIPTWYVGGVQSNIGQDGYLAGRYTKIGKTVHFKIVMTTGGSGTNLGSTGQAWSWKLPVPASQAHSSFISVSGTVNYKYPIVQGGISGGASSSEIFPYIMDNTVFEAVTVINGGPYNLSMGPTNLSIVNLFGTYEEA
jgi:hypothetical protein